MIVAQLVDQPGLKLLQLLPYFNILVVCLLEGAPIELFFFIDEEHLVFFSGENLRQLHNSVLCLAQCHNFLTLAELGDHS